MLAHAGGPLSFAAARRASRSTVIVTVRSAERREFHDAFRGQGSRRPTSAPRTGSSDGRPTATGTRLAPHAVRKARRHVGVYRLADRLHQVSPPCKVSSSALSQRASRTKRRYLQDMAAANPYGLDERGMLDEAHRIIDAARAEGVTLRLVGGLAVREHCRVAAFCERPYHDIDLAVPRRSAKARPPCSDASGGPRTARSPWRRRRQAPVLSGPAATAATRGRRTSTTASTSTSTPSPAPHDRPAAPPGDRALHGVDSDVALVKLQRTVANDDDLRDIVTVVKTPPP